MSRSLKAPVPFSTAGNPQPGGGVAMNFAARLSVKSGEAKNEDIYYQLGGAESRLDDLGPLWKERSPRAAGGTVRPFFSLSEELQHPREDTWAGWARQR